MKYAVLTSLLFVTSIASAQVPLDLPLATAIDEEIVVTASGVRETVESVPAAVTVITREEIELREARDVADVLREVPGLTLSRTGSAGRATSLFTRGGNSNHTLVLWNGIEINNPYFAGYDWGRFSTAGVEQIEIVRGPFSALYGSDAMSGVVNVLTVPSRTGFGVNLQAGERGLVNVAADASMLSGGFSASGALERRKDEGFDPNDDFEQNNGSLSLRWGTQKVSFGLQGRYTDYDLGIPFDSNAAGDALVPSLLRRQDGDELQLAVPLTYRFGASALEATLSRVERTDNFSDPNGSFGFTFANTDSTISRLNTLVRTPTAIGTIIVGGEYEESDVADVSTFGENLTGQERNSRSLFVEDRYTHPMGNARLELSGGVRYDDYETFGSEISPRIAAAFLSNGHKFRAAYGEGFRAPSLGELYFPFSGNEELEAERSENIEVGYDRYFDSSNYISFTVFDTQYDNLIVFDNSTFIFENSGASTSRGLEAGAGGRVGPLDASLSYTFLDTEQTSTGDALLRRPKHSGSVSLSYAAGAFGSTLVVLHQGLRDDILPISPYSRVESEAHTTADLNLKYRIGQLEPYLRIENLTDESYEEVRGYASPRRRVLIGLRYRR